MDQAQGQLAQDPRRSPARRLWTATWKFAVFLTVWAVFYAPFVLSLTSGGGGSGAPLGLGTRVLIELFGAVTMLLAAWIMLRFADRRPFISLGFRRANLGVDTFIGVSLGVGMIGVAVAVIGLFGEARLLSPIGFSWSALAMLGCSLLLNTVSQEVLTRGYLLQTVESDFGVLAALVVSSVVFTGLHAGAIVEGGWIPGLNLLAAGMLLGLAYTTTGNLWLPIALHFAWNFLQGPVLGITVTGQALDGGWRLVELGGPDMISGGPFGLEGGLAATVVTLAGIAALCWRDRRRVGAPARSKPV